MNYNKNDLIDRTLNRYIVSYETLLETEDCIPIQVQQEISKYIFKCLRKDFKNINRENRYYQCQEKIKNYVTKKKEKYLNKYHKKMDKKAFKKEKRLTKRADRKVAFNEFILSVKNFFISLKNNIKKIFKRRKKK